MPHAEPVALVEDEVVQGVEAAADLVIVAQGEDRLASIVVLIAIHLSGGEPSLHGQAMRPDRELQERSACPITLLDQVVRRIVDVRFPRHAVTDDANEPVLEVMLVSALAPAGIDDASDALMGCVLVAGAETERVHLGADEVPRDDRGAAFAPVAVDVAHHVAVGVMRPSLRLPSSADLFDHEPARIALALQLGRGERSVERRLGLHPRGERFAPLLLQRCIGDTYREGIGRLRHLVDRRMDAAVAVDDTIVPVVSIVEEAQIRLPALVDLLLDPALLIQDPLLPASVRILDANERAAVVVLVDPLASIRLGN